MTHLCDLPNELLITIINHISDSKTLCSLAQVSSRYRPFAESRIYQSILVRHGNALKSFRDSLAKRPERAACVQVVELAPNYNGAWKSVGWHVEKVLSNCVNLRELMVESPTCNYGRWSDGDRGNGVWRNMEQVILRGLRVVGLQRLSKLTLHLDGRGDRYWNPMRTETSEYCWGKVMALPTLTELTVSCALIHNGLEVAPARTSNLKKLELIECNITLGGLRKMLAAPRALEVLHLGENAHHGSQGLMHPDQELRYHGMPSQNLRCPDYNNLFGYDPAPFIDILLQQSHALERLTYISGDIDAPSQLNARDFKDFLRLKEVILSEHVRERCQQLILWTAPVLETLTLHIPAVKVFALLMELENEQNLGAGKVSDDLVRKDLASKVPAALFKEPPKTSLERLKTLRIVMPHGPFPVSGSRRTWVRMLADHFLKHSLDFQLYYLHRTSIFPPILFDEGKSAPREILLFSTQKGFTEAANAPDPFGFEDTWNFDTMGEDVLANFDFDAFLHATPGEEAGHWLGEMDLADFHAAYGM